MSDTPVIVCRITGNSHVFFTMPTLQEQEAFTATEDMAAILPLRCGRLNYLFAAVVIERNLVMQYVDINISVISYTINLIQVSLTELFS